MKPIESVPIELDKPRTMRLDMLALMRAQYKLNALRGVEPTVSIYRTINMELRRVAFGGDDSGTDIPIDLMLVLFWVSLLHEDPALTLEQAGELATNPLMVMAKVMQLIKMQLMQSISDHADETVEVGEGPLAPPNGAPPSHSDVSS